MSLYVGGCRAQHGGIHLGHVYGCFLSLPFETPLHFVISDVLGSSVIDSSVTAVVARDVIAVAAHLGLPVKVSRESVIRKMTGSLALRLTHFVSYREIAEAHPPREKVKSSGYRGPLNDFLFPIYQAAYLLALGADTACYNDDNSRFVDLTRRLARRINKTDQTRFNESLKLIQRQPGRLPGWDGERMTKANGNALSLGASGGDIRRFAERLVGRSSEGNADFDNESPTPIERLFLTSFGTPTNETGESPTGLARIHHMHSVLQQFLSFVQTHHRPDNDVLAILDLNESEVLDRICTQYFQARFQA